MSRQLVPNRTRRVVCVAAGVLGLALGCTAPAAAQVPNYKTFAQNLAKEGHDLTTKAGDICFVQELAFRLNRTVDNRIGHLRKSSGQNHGVDGDGNRHAVDAILFRPTGQSIDVIGNSATSKASVSWLVDKPRYSDKDFYTPTHGCTPGGSTPTPDPEPPPSNPPVDDDLRAILTKIAETYVDVHERLGTIDGRIDALEQQLVPSVTGVGQRLEEVKEQLNELASRPITVPCMSGRAGFLGTVTLCPQQ